MLLIHIVLYVLILALGVALYFGWIQLDILDDRRGKQLFLLVALAGNTIGLMLTLGNAKGEVALRLERDADLDYEEQFEVSTSEGEKGSLDIQVPKIEDPTQEEDEDAEEESEQDWRQELLYAIEDYNETLEDPEYYYLLEEWDGKKLSWEYQVDQTGAMLAALSFVAGIMLLIQQSRKKAEARAKRYEEMLLDYPGLIMKFTLLVQAGMPVRKAFQKMAADYRRKRGRKKQAAYEEILVTCYEMESGVSEMEAYRRFGERCGQVKYKTFSTLLIQNLQKGSRQLADMLEAESLEAWDDRKRKAKVLGEAASTKLLIPMIMMLGIVMALVMMPALMSL
jgi:tight adherence protein C